MATAKHGVAFCTCDDPECPFNPCNHSKGCTPCIAKNLRQHEIPTCLFYAVSREKLPEDIDDWSWESFARHVQAHPQA